MSHQQISPPNTNDYSFIEEKLSNTRNVSYHMTASILIPFYRDMVILEKTIASLTTQDYPKDLWDVVISGDGTNEPVDDLVSKYRQYIDIKFINYKREGYQLNKARNHGIRHSNKDVIVMIDFDMICPSHFLASHMRWFHVSDSVSTIGLRRFIYAREIVVDDILEQRIDYASLPEIVSISNTNRMSVKDKRIPELSFIKQHPYPCNVFHGCNVAFRRDAANHVGLFDESLTDYEDLEFGYRLSKSGIFLVFDQSLTNYHQENEIISVEDRTKYASLNRTRYFQMVPGVEQFRIDLAEGRYDKLIKDIPGI